METRLPEQGQWYTRNNRGGGKSERYKDRPTDIIFIGEVNHESKDITCLRFGGFDGTTPQFVRRTKVRFATWLDEADRFELRDAPTPPGEPVPEEPAREPTMAEVFAELRHVRALLEKAVGGQLGLFGRAT